MEKHDHQEHVNLRMFRELTIIRLRDCEAELVDPNIKDCIAPATHMVRQLGLAVCAGHADSITAIHKEQLDAEAARLNAEEAPSEAQSQETQVPALGPEKQTGIQAPAVLGTIN